MKRRLLLALLALLPLPLTATPMAEMEEEGVRTACGLCAGIALLVPLVVLATSVVIAVWVYRDAEDRGDRNAALWAIVGFVFNVVGLLIYLLARKPVEPPTPPPEPPAA